ncbi:hypothetical protein V1477_020906 [Vespula maculifrons]|uniref:Uncharacterized protein n=1 Tax=Vespula maculifrons TaxID=7453 RepID=A0ABD2AN89_VESMC
MDTLFEVNINSHEPFQFERKGQNKLFVRNKFLKKQYPGKEDGCGFIFEDTVTLARQRKRMDAKKEEKKEIAYSKSNTLFKTIKSLKRFKRLGVSVFSHLPNLPSSCRKSID